MVKIWGGGGSSIDSSTLVALQSDMVELKSDVTTLETNVSNLIYDIPNVKLNAPLSSIQFFGGSNNVLMQKIAYNNNPSDLQYCTLVVDGIANPEATDCRLRVTSSGTIQTSTNAGSTWTTLSGEGSSDVTLSGSLEKLEFAGRLDQALIAVKGNLDGGTGLSYYSLAARAFADITYAAYQMKPVSEGIAYSNDYGKTWTTITASSGSGSGSSGSESLVLNGALRKVYMSAQTYSDSSQSVIKLAATIGDTGATSQQYALAVPAIANSASPSVQMRPTSSGIETSLDYGKTWKLLSASSGDSAGSGSNSGSGVYFSNPYDSVFTSAYINYNGANASISLNGPNHGSGQLYPLCNALADMAHPSQYGTQLALYNGAICLGDSNEWRQISSADLSDAESLSMSNMIWLSDNASKLAALLNS